MTDRPTNQRPTDRPGHRAVKFQTTTKSLPRSSGSFVIFSSELIAALLVSDFVRRFPAGADQWTHAGPWRVWSMSNPGLRPISSVRKSNVIYTCMHVYLNIVVKKTNVHSSPFITVRSSCLSASFKSKHTVRIIEKNGTSFPGRPCQRRTSNSCSRPWPWSLRESWPQDWLSSRSPAR